MINQSTIAALRAMKLTAMADELEAQFADQTTYSVIQQIIRFKFHHYQSK